MEDTLDKIAGKGDLRAKVILLQKEIESMKKNHDMMIDEIKRDYGKLSTSKIDSF